MSRLESSDSSGVEVEAENECESTLTMVMVPEGDGVLVSIPKGVNMVAVEPSGFTSSWDDLNKQGSSGEDSKESLGFENPPSSNSDSEDEPSRSGSDILNKGYPPSLKESDVWRIQTLYHIPESVEIRAPKSYERVDREAKSWICVYEKWFHDGLRLPIPRLA